MSDVYGSSEGGGASVGGGSSGGGGGSYGEKVYSASLDVKKGTQKYDLLSSDPGFATATVTFKGTANFDHSSSIAITDTNGTYQQDVYGGGSYWFTRNSAGQYVGNVILNKFDPNTGNFVTDYDTKKQVVIDPNTSSLTQTATQLDMHLQQVAESNIEDQNIFKSNYTGQ